MPNSLHGVLLPVITPFYQDQVDYVSYTKLIHSYLGKGVHGVIPLGTTGEVPTIEEDEYLQIVETTIEIVAGRVPIYVGISSNSTRKALHLVQIFSRLQIAGFLITSPYYNLPSQQGVYDHFLNLSEATDRQIIIYNIPYRTGRNIENDTILRLSRVPNIIGIKDSCGNIAQTVELLRERDPSFSVLTGEDILFYLNIVNGGDGGILASAHLNTESYLRTYQLVRKNDHQQALSEWNMISKAIPFLFKEPNPAPLKYILFKKGLIRSEEVRLPLASISDALKRTLDQFLMDGAI